MGTPGAYKAIEEKYRKPMAILLPELFEKLGSEKGVAAELGVHRQSVAAWIKDLKLKEWTVLRPREEKRT